MTRTDAGSLDLERAAKDLAGKLPERLAPFAEMAYNYGWVWQRDARALFEAIDRERFQKVQRNPVRLLQEASAARLEEVAADDALITHAEATLARLKADRDREPAFSATLDAAHPVAFMCAEYAVHVSLPVYSGGLGALAGDILKEASDLAVPLVAVGLMYNRGYFRQRLDANGWQHEYWIDTDPRRIPAALVTDDNDEVLKISVPIGDTEVKARIWRVDVGRIPLFLLDTDFPENDSVQRWITARLYEGDTDLRIAQYTLLGVGGIRALRAMGIDPGLIHLNEGHAALAPIEFALGDPNRKDESVEELLAAARVKTIFTTHTPVPAGNDSYPAAQMRVAWAGTAKANGLEVDDLINLGQTDQSNHDAPFGITQMALRMSSAANGVSRKHGEVAREMWTELFPGKSAEEVPIGHVTNGVHVPTWIGTPIRVLMDKYLGADWQERADDRTTWIPVAKIPNDELWAARCKQRAQLVEFIAHRSTQDRLQRFESISRAQAAAEALSPDYLTVGFARRVATYKRLELLVNDTEWTHRMLTSDKPLQLIIAGKAHPRDDEAKATVASLFGHKNESMVPERVIFLEDYDLSIASMLVRGCDVWLNMPRPPMEASGTSGMKSAVNGGLHLSVLDGWWDEGYTPGNGWAIPAHPNDDPQTQDARDGAVLRKLLEEEVVPLFYDRDEDGIPRGWMKMIKASLATNGPEFSASRMVKDYVTGPYARERD